MGEMRSCGCLAAMCTRVKGQGTYKLLTATEHSSKEQLTGRIGSEVQEKKGGRIAAGKCAVVRVVECVEGK